MPSPRPVPRASRTWAKSWPSSRARRRAEPTWPPSARKSKPSSAVDRRRSMAGRIPQAFIDEVVARSDIVEIIGARVPLKKSGREFKACCPFHNEKSPSFTVSPTKQFYHCFGCGVHGTAISFLMEHSGLTFPEAVKELSQSVGLTVPQEPSMRGGAGGEGYAPAPGKAVSGALIEVMQAACDFYRKQLRTAPNAIEYLK